MIMSSTKAPKPNSKTTESSIPDEEFVIRKRLPRSLPREHNDVYVTRKTPIKVRENAYICSALRLILREHLHDQAQNINISAVFLVSLCRGRAKASKHTT